MRSGARWPAAPWPRGSPETSSAAQSAEKPIPAAGPYYVKLWDIANQTIQLERNRFYGGSRKRNFDSIEFKYGQPLDTGYTRCETGESDVCAVPTRAANEVASKYGENRERYFVRPSMVVERSARLFGEARSAAYAKLDADLMKDAAPIAPYLQRNNRLLLSSSVGCFDYHFWYGTDLASLCRR